MNMRSISLVSAILLNISKQGFDKFSIWDLTRGIRDDVNTLKYIIDDRGTNIIHDEVKAKFEEIASLQLSWFQDYDESWNSAGFREYQLPQPTIVVDKNDDDDYNDDDNDINPYIHPADLQKIITYMSNQLDPVTVKQVQSRLKGSRYTCSELAAGMEYAGLIQDCDDNTPPSKRLSI